MTGERILIVEDEEITTMDEKGLLTDSGYVVTSTVEAVEKHKK